MVPEWLELAVIYAVNAFYPITGELACVRGGAPETR
jgi:hypothetical protein